MTNRSIVSSSCIFNTPRDGDRTIDDVLDTSQSTNDPEEFEILKNVINPNETFASTTNKSKTEDGDSLRSSVVSSYTKDVIKDAKDVVQNENMAKHAPHPPISPSSSMSSRSSSMISHYLNNMITNVATNINKDNKKREKALTFANLNTSTVSASSVGSVEVQNYIGDMLSKVVKIMHVEEVTEETSGSEEKKINPQAINKTHSLIHEKSFSEFSIVSVSDELDDPKVESELDDYIDKIIKTIALELSNPIYPNENNRSVEIKFDQSELINQRPITASSWKGKSITKDEDDNDDESLKNSSTHSVNELVVKEANASQKENSKRSMSKLSSTDKQNNNSASRKTASKTSIRSKVINNEDAFSSKSSSVISVKRSEYKEDAQSSKSSTPVSTRKIKSGNESNKSNSHTATSVSVNNIKDARATYSSSSFTSSRTGSKMSMKSEPKIVEAENEGYVEESKQLSPVLSKNDPLLTDMSMAIENQHELNPPEEPLDAVETNDIKIENETRNNATSATDMMPKNEAKSFRNKKLQVNLSPTRRRRSKDKYHRHLSDSYQMFDESYLMEKDAAVQTSQTAKYYESSRKFLNDEEIKKKLINSIGIQVANDAENDDKRLLKREKSRKRNLDYRRIFYYYHEELRKLQNTGPKIDKAIENHVNRMKNANKNILREEMFDDANNSNIIIAPVMFQVSNSHEYNPSSSSFYTPETDMGGYCTDTAKLSKIAYDVRKDEVKLRNRLLYGNSAKSSNSQTFEDRYLIPSKRQFLPFGTILKVPTLKLGHQKEKISYERERELVARLHDSRVSSVTRKKEVN